MNNDTPQHFVFLLVDEFTHLAFSCAIEPLRIANLISGKTLYKWSLMSANGKTATASNDVVTQVDRGFSELVRGEMLFVLSGLHVKENTTPELLSVIRRERAKGHLAGALCSGAYCLARAGAMNGLATSIHWDFHDSFMEEFPEVKLVRNVFVANEKYITASGGTATADLMLHLIERDYGHDLGIEVADMMLHNSVREPTAEQKLSLQSRHGIRNAHLSKAIKMMTDNLEHPIPPSEIAEEVGISARQLERLFGRHLNCSPKKYYVDMRLQKARNLLLQTEKTVTEISFLAGFASPAHFARVYRNQFGITPMNQRGKIV
ncbi:MAG: GlxA family transcriptional regulator [Paracoccaceae bacterium]|nr:GlxA family transcriptional regulator [Paracoccaceae bacterium]MDG1738520.1 GlxA family transcriptional regulator [Paracoccaceae bacterium]MDG2260226.1 GlxA family transcriptional regulator [Paracoccaceae bacterium]